MQNAGPQYGEGVAPVQESPFATAQVQNSSSNSTASLRQFRKKDVDKLGGNGGGQDSTNSSHVARVAPHNHYPHKQNEYFRYPTQYQEYSSPYKEPTVKYSEIAEPIIQQIPHLDHLPPSVLSKHKEKDYVEMCNIPQQGHLNKAYPEHQFNSQQNYPPDMSMHHQYMHKEPQVSQMHSPYKPESQYIPKEGTYNHQVSPFLKYNMPQSRNYAPLDNSSLAPFQRMDPHLARSFMSEHHHIREFPTEYTPMEQSRMYAQKQRYYPTPLPPSNTTYSPNYPHRNMPAQQYNYPSCNYPRAQMNSSMGRYPMNPMERSISPRRTYTENMEIPMNFPAVPQKIQASYPNYPAYAQHYQQRRPPAVSQEYYHPQQHPHPRSHPQYIQNHHPQEIPENHVASNNIRQYLENWAEEEPSTEIPANIENPKYIPRMNRDETNEVYVINASELPQYLENGVPLIASENGQYIFKSNVSIDNTGAIKILDKSGENAGVPTDAQERVVSLHIIENPKTDCVGNRPPNVNTENHAAAINVIATSSNAERPYNQHGFNRMNPVHQIPPVQNCDSSINLSLHPKTKSPEKPFNEVPQNSCIVIPPNQNRLNFDESLLPNPVPCDAKKKEEEISNVMNEEAILKEAHEELDKIVQDTLTSTNMHLPLENCDGPLSKIEEKCVEENLNSRIPDYLNLDLESHPKDFKSTSSEPNETIIDLSTNSRRTSRGGSEEVPPINLEVESRKEEEIVKEDVREKELPDQAQNETASTVKHMPLIFDDFEEHSFQKEEHLTEPEVIKEDVSISAPCIQQEKEENDKEKVMLQQPQEQNTMPKAEESHPKEENTQEEEGNQTNTVSVIESSDTTEQTTTVHEETEKNDSNSEKILVTPDNSEIHGTKEENTENMDQGKSGKKNESSEDTGTESFGTGMKRKRIFSVDDIINRIGSTSNQIQNISNEENEDAKKEETKVSDETNPAISPCLVTQENIEDSIERDKKKEECVAANNSENEKFYDQIIKTNEAPKIEDNTVSFDLKSELDILDGEEEEKTVKIVSETEDEVQGSNGLKEMNQEVSEDAIKTVNDDEEKIGATESVPSEDKEDTNGEKIEADLFPLKDKENTIIDQIEGIELVPREDRENTRREKIEETELVPRQDEENTNNEKSEETVLVSREDEENTNNEKIEETELVLREDEENTNSEKIEQPEIVAREDDNNTNDEKREVVPTEDGSKNEENLQESVEEEKEVPNEETTEESISRDNESRDTCILMDNSETCPSIPKENEEVKISEDTEEKEDENVRKCTSVTQENVKFEDIPQPVETDMRPENLKRCLVDEGRQDEESNENNIKRIKLDPSEDSANNIKAVEEIPIQQPRFSVIKSTENLKKEASIAISSVDTTVNEPVTTSSKVDAVTTETTPKIEDQITEEKTENIEVSNVKSTDEVEKNFETTKDEEKHFNKAKRASKEEITFEERFVEPLLKNNSGQQKTDQEEDKSSLEDLQYRSVLKIEENMVLLEICGELVEISVNQINGKKVITVVPISSSATVDINDNYENTDRSSVTSIPIDSAEMPELYQEVCEEIVEENDEKRLPVLMKMITSSEDEENVLRNEEITSTQSETINNNEDVFEDIILNENEIIIGDESLEEEINLDLKSDEVTVDTKPALCTKAAKKLYDDAPSEISPKTHSSLREFRKIKSKPLEDEKNCNDDVKDKTNLKGTIRSSNRQKDISEHKGESKVALQELIKQRKMRKEKIRLKYSQYVLGEPEVPENLEKEVKSEVRKVTNVKTENNQVSSAVHKVKTTNDVKRKDHTDGNKTKSKDKNRRRSVDDNRERVHLIASVILKEATSNVDLDKKKLEEKPTSTSSHLPTNQTPSASNFHEVRPSIDAEVAKNQSLQDRHSKFPKTSAPRDLSLTKHVNDHYLSRKDHSNLKKKLSIQEYNSRKRKMEETKPPPQNSEKVMRKEEPKKVNNVERNHQKPSTIYSGRQFESISNCVKDPRRLQFINSENPGRSRSNSEDSSCSKLSNISLSRSFSAGTTSCQSAVNVNHLLNKIPTPGKLFIESSEPKTIDPTSLRPSETLKRKVSFDDNVQINEIHTTQTKSFKIKQDSSSSYCEVTSSCSDTFEERSHSDDQLKHQNMSVERFKNTERFQNDWEDSNSPKDCITDAFADCFLEKNKLETVKTKSKLIIDINDFDTSTINNQLKNSYKTNTNLYEENSKNYKEEVDLKLNSLNIQIPKTTKNRVLNEDDILMHKFLRKEQLSSEEIKQIRRIIYFKKKMQQLQLKPQNNKSEDNYEVKKSPEESLKLQLKKIDCKVKKKKKRFRNLYSESPETSDTEVQGTSGEFSVVESENISGVKLIFKRKTDFLNLQPVVKIQRCKYIDAMAKKMKLSDFGTK